MINKISKCLILLVSISLSFSVFALDYPYSVVRQTEYNCIPASIEMVYRIYDVDNISQYSVRRDIGYDGAIYVDDMEEYLDNNFDYDRKLICCVDSLLNSIGEYPVILIVDQQKLSWRDYNGHSLVAISYEYSDNGNVYVKVLDPDYGVLEYNATSVLKAISSWYDYVYIIKGIKQK